MAKKCPNKLTPCQESDAHACYCTRYNVHPDRAKFKCLCHCHLPPEPGDSWDDDDDAA